MPRPDREFRLSQTIQALQEEIDVLKLTLTHHEEESRQGQSRETSIKEELQRR
jgi:hypothetical protein